MDYVDIAKAILENAGACVVASALTSYKGVVLAVKDREPVSENSDWVPVCKWVGVSLVMGDLVFRDAENKTVAITSATSIPELRVWWGAPVLVFDPDHLTVFERAKYEN